MNPDKTIVLRFKPIGEITEDEMKKKVLATDGIDWLQGFINKYSESEYSCCDSNGSCLDEVMFYAVLPKDE